MSERALTQRALRAWASAHPDDAPTARRIADNLSLSRVRRVTRRPREEREALDLSPMIGRMTRALARRAAEGDLDALLALRTAETSVADAMRTAAEGLHVFGYSWTQIAEHVGITRQAARQRWGNR